MTVAVAYDAKLTFEGVEHKVIMGGVKFENNLEGQPSVLPRPGLLDDAVSVTGTITCDFHFQEDPVWKRELLWATHNLIAHPLSEILHWVGFLYPPAREFGLWLHDKTVPVHWPGTGRG